MAKTALIPQLVYKLILLATCNSWASLQRLASELRWRPRCCIYPKGPSIQSSGTWAGVGTIVIQDLGKYAIIGYLEPLTYRGNKHPPPGPQKSGRLHMLSTSPEPHNIYKQVPSQKQAPMQKCVPRKHTCLTDFLLRVLTVIKATCTTQYKPLPLLLRPFPRRRPKSENKFRSGDAPSIARLTLQALG